MRETRASNGTRWELEIMNVTLDVEFSPAILMDKSQVEFRVLWPVDLEDGSISQ